MTQEQRRVAKATRQNDRDFWTGVVTFITLAVATIFDFRDDMELVVAFQGALIAMVHRAHRNI